MSQYVNKGCSTSWNYMLQHFDKLVDSTLSSLDVAGANPDNIIKVIKEVGAEGSVKGRIMIGTEWAISLPSRLAGWRE